MDDNLRQEFISQAIFRLQENRPRIQRCLDLLSEDQVWQKPSPHSNCIGNLILHLQGNITQYIEATLHGKPDIRKRQTEFEAYSQVSKSELWTCIDQCIQRACDIIIQLPTEAFLKKYQVQCYNLSGVGIIIHVVEHLSYHVGQISFYTKQLTDADLGYYKDAEL
jgi:uncharacterized damage-inducible protein DinB